MDEVKAVISDCRTSSASEALPEGLTHSLSAIPVLHAPFECEAFEELITEFLDGFVPAGVYHKFEEHAASCEACSSILTEVVYAVAACHGVHIYEHFDPSKELMDRLEAIAPPSRTKARIRFAASARALVARLTPLSTPGPMQSLSMGLALLGLTVAFVLVGFSDDGTLGGVYRQANVKADELYNRGSRAYSQADRIVAEIKEAKSDLGQLWNAMGGETDSEVRKDPAPKRDELDRTDERSK
ncbi:MAG TPA: zf-HC2 domain-containing protein [Blastocatellia bacterium]|nr:zf-HC2 domain-containing protein [Blastocatellia bacterium]